MHDHTETIGTNIDNQMYSGKQLEDAQAIMNDTTSWIEALNTANRSTLDDLVARAESFLGI